MSKGNNTRGNHSRGDNKTGASKHTDSMIPLGKGMAISRRAALDGTQIKASGEGPLGPVHSLDLRINDKTDTVTVMRGGTIIGVYNANEFAVAGAVVTDHLTKRKAQISA